MTIKCNHIEAVKIQNDLISEIAEVEERMKKLKSRLLIIDDIIKSNNDSNSSWIVHVPIAILNRKEIGKGKSLNWKKEVFKLIAEFDMPMNSEMIYHKLLLKYNDVPQDRKFAIRNISAALHYLTFKDGKLSRCKDQKGRGFVYGKKGFFESEVELKAEYLKKYNDEVEL